MIPYPLVRRTVPLIFEVYCVGSLVGDTSLDYIKVVPVLN
jgi:hypothetical protein